MENKFKAHLRYDGVMAIRRKTKKKAEFGDFQTPLDLAGDVCGLLARRGLLPASVLEPTCGRGSFLTACLETFPTISRAIGIEINGDYVIAARSSSAEKANGGRAEIRQEDFFQADWPEILESLSDPLLIIGNPPWVTNAELGILGSSNLPVKSNFQNHKGIDAITGKGNFDISEWMLIRSLEWMRGRSAVLAMLCKTAVARKVLLHAWRVGRKVGRADVYLIDAVKHFGAAVHGCLLVVDSSVSTRGCDCQVHDSLGHGEPSAVWGYRDGDLAADIGAYERWKHLEGKERYRWRSGVKHDCSKVMEFHEDGGGCRNGFGDRVHLEPDYLYPMLKSADVANGSVEQPKRWMLVTQRAVGEDTNEIREKAPLTWRYLEKHGELLDRRASSIYQKRPRFSVFGVGEYSFAPWKVAVSGFYKKPVFNVIGPFQGKPVVLDDTCCFVACGSKEEAELVARLLNSDIAKEFFSTRVFWDAKRPITVALLRRLDLLSLANDLGLKADLEKHLYRLPSAASNPDQMLLDLGPWGA